MVQADSRFDLEARRDALPFSMPLDRYISSHLLLGLVGAAVSLRSTFDQSATCLGGEHASPRGRPKPVSLGALTNHPEASRFGGSG